MPALFIRMSRRGEEERKVVAAALTEEREARSSSRYEMLALGVVLRISAMALLNFCWVRAAR